MDGGGERIVVVMSLSSGGTHALSRGNLFVTPPCVSMTDRHLHISNVTKAVGLKCQSIFDHSAFRPISPRATPFCASKEQFAAKTHTS